MKGASAIEYLTTYGWMLLVIAIVGGAIFTTIQENQESTIELDQIQNNNELLSEMEDLTDYNHCEVIDDPYDEHINCVENGTTSGFNYTIQSQFNMDNESGTIVITNR